MLYLGFSIWRNSIVCWPLYSVSSKEMWAMCKEERGPHGRKGKHHSSWRVREEQEGNSTRQVEGGGVVHKYGTKRMEETYTRETGFRTRREHERNMRILTETPGSFLEHRWNKGSLKKSTKVTHRTQICQTYARVNRVDWRGGARETTWPPAH